MFVLSRQSSAQHGAGSLVPGIFLNLKYNVHTYFDIAFLFGLGIHSSPTLLRLQRESFSYKNRKGFGDGHSVSEVWYKWLMLRVTMVDDAKRRGRAGATRFPYPYVPLSTIVLAVLSGV